MSVRQKRYDKPRKRKEHKQRALRLFAHSLWERYRMPYLITCPKGHRLGRGSEPFIGEVECKKCHKMYSGEAPSQALMAKRMAGEAQGE